MSTLRCRLLNRDCACCLYKCFTRWLASKGAKVSPLTVCSPPSCLLSVSLSSRGSNRAPHLAPGGYISAGPREGAPCVSFCRPQVFLYGPPRGRGPGLKFRTRRGSFDQVSTSLSCASLSPVLSSGCLRLCKPLLHILLISCSSFPTSQQPGDTQPRAV